MSRCSESIFSHSNLSSVAPFSKKAQGQNEGPGVTEADIKAWNDKSATRTAAATGSVSGHSSNTGSAPNVPKHQKVFLPNVQEESESVLRGRKVNRAKSKNAPSQITVLGLVDTTYHHPPEELFNELIGGSTNGAKPNSSQMRRIENARQWGRKEAPIKLHHRELEEVEDDNDRAKDGGLSKLDPIVMDALLPPKDFIQELTQSGPLETKYKKLRQSMEFSDAKIRNQERELKLLHQMRDVKKLQKKMEKGAVSDISPLDAQKVKIDKNIVAKAEKKAQERFLERQALSMALTGPNAIRDQNHLLKSRPGATGAETKTAQKQDPYLVASQHKKQFPEKRIFASPYSSSKAEALPSRQLPKTQIPSGEAVMRHFAAKINHEDKMNNRGLNLTGDKPSNLLEQQQRMSEGKPKRNLPDA